MTAINETAYPRLKPNPTQQELKQNFLPTPEEFKLLNGNTSSKSPHSQLGFMLSLKCYQCLGYHASINTIPKPIVELVLSKINLMYVILVKYHHQKGEANVRF